MRRMAQGFTEYVIILSTVLAAFLAMRVYLQRAVQGRIKDVTDAFLAPQNEQTEDTQGVFPLLHTVDPQALSPLDGSVIEDISESDLEYSSGAKQMSRSAGEMTKIIRQNPGSSDMETTITGTMNTKSYYFVKPDTSLDSNDELVGGGGAAESASNP